MEIEFWALWLLSQEWRWKAPTISAQDNPRSWLVTVDNDIDLDSVMNALEEVAQKQENTYYWETLPKMRLLDRKQQVDEEEAESTAKTLEKAADRSTVHYDEDEGLAAMVAWAKGVPKASLRGVPDSVPRYIGSLARPAEVLHV
jgi:hypothetical protein